MNWQVPKTWEGETAFIIAGGPSLRTMVIDKQGAKKPELFDASILRKRGRVITINDAWALAPWADVNYFYDSSWWRMQIDKNPGAWDRKTGMVYRTFHDQIYKGFWVSGSQDFATHPQVHALRLTGQTGLETKSDGLKHGSNSGYQCINLAYLFGAKRIVLLGYDMQPATNGRTHWHSEPRQSNFAQVLKLSMLPHFETLVQPLKEAGVEVLNANPNSALQCWPKVTVEQVFNPQMELLEKES